MDDFTKGMLFGWLVVLVWAVAGVLTGNMKFEWMRRDKRKPETPGKGTR